MSAGPILDVGALPKKGDLGPSLSWTTGWWYVTDGNDYYYYFFGDDDVIYIKQRPSPNFVPSKKGTGVQGKVKLNDHGVTITWTSGTVEVFTRWNWTDTNMMLAPAGRYAPLKATRMFT